MYKYIYIYIYVFIYLFIYICLNWATYIKELMKNHGAQEITGDGKVVTGSTRNERGQGRLQRRQKHIGIKWDFYMEVY